MNHKSSQYYDDISSFVELHSLTIITENKCWVYDIDYWWKYIALIDAMKNFIRDPCMKE